ncbi:anti-sigma factor family protein [Streptomyces sp. JNUCC 63]
MTTTTDAAGHPDVTEISDLTEGLLGPSRTTDLRRHLGECELCADVHTSLEEIRGLLGTLPEPPDMPGDIVDRVDAALAAEAAETAKDTEPGAVVNGTHVSRETSVADRPSGSARASSTGPGRKLRTRRGRRRIAVLGSAFTVAALGVASVVVATLHDDKGSDTTAHGRPSASAGTFSAGTLEAQVANLLQKTQKAPGDTRAPRSFGVDPAPGTGKPKVLKTPAVTVPSCVRQGISDSGAPLAAQAGTYDGKDAYLVVLPDSSGDSTHVMAYLVDASCVRHPAATPKVLLKHSYAR